MTMRLPLDELLRRDVHIQKGSSLLYSFFIPSIVVNIKPNTRPFVSNIDGFHSPSYHIYLDLNLLALIFVARV